MKYGSYVTKFYTDNEVFSNIDSLKKYPDGWLGSMSIMKQKLLEVGVDLNTSDLLHPEDADFILYDGIDNITEYKNKIVYFNTPESDIVRPEDFLIKNHTKFDKVFTWSDDLVNYDPLKYIKTNHSFCFPENIKIGLDGRDKLCTMIAGNKMIYKPTELYSKRLEAIKWFEKNHPNDFDLYGIEWDEFWIRSKIKLFRAINRFKPLRKWIKPTRPSYRGTVVRKKDTLERYKFSICYENATSNGYVTEKIFDSFFAGCVPIYLGAPNVLEYIPSECFIDMRNFKSYDDLYDYICGMSDSAYLKYQISILDFLKSPKGYEFSAERNAEIWIDELRKDGLLNAEK